MDSHCNTSSWFILSILAMLGTLNLDIQIAKIVKVNGRISYQTRSDIGTILRGKQKYSFCNGPHSNLLFCKKLPHMRQVFKT